MEIIINTISINITIIINAINIITIITTTIIITTISLDIYGGKIPADIWLYLILSGGDQLQHHHHYRRYLISMYHTPYIDIRY